MDPLGLSAWDDAKSGACHEGICRLFSVFIGPDKFDSTDDAAFEALKKQMDIQYAKVLNMQA